MKLQNESSKDAMSFWGNLNGTVFVEGLEVAFHKILGVWAGIVWMPTASQALSRPVYYPPEPAFKGLEEKTCILA